MRTAAFETGTRESVERLQVLPSRFVAAFLPFRILSSPKRFRCGHEATLAKAVQPSVSNDLGKWLGRKDPYLLNLRWFSK
jgi:hypothetical protein